MRDAASAVSFQDEGKLDGNSRHVNLWPADTNHLSDPPKASIFDGCVCVVFSPKMPEEEVSYFAVGLGTLQQEVGEGAVVVWLIAQHLHQL